MAQLSTPICDAPFLPAAQFPPTGGDVFGRLCVNLAQGYSNVSCCLPCPVTDWVYSNSFPHRARDAGYVAIAMLVMNVFLLLSFALLPKDQSHRHYLSTGLLVSLVIIAIAFIIPLGTTPNQCYDAVTPNDLHTDASCGVTGTFVEFGAMGVVVWILLRSIWMALRIMANFKRTALFATVSTIIGVGLPLIFLAISLPITGVSYRLGGVCVPSNPTALVTWFAWVLLFAAISWIIQIVTILYCLWKFASSSLAGETGHTSNVSQSSTIRSEDLANKEEAPRPTSEVIGEPIATPAANENLHTVTTGERPTPSISRSRLSRSDLSAGRKRRIAWRRVRSILILQWRTIVMSFIIVNLAVFFGQDFIQQTTAMLAATRSRGAPQPDLEFAECLIVNKGNKTPCLHDFNGLGLSEAHAVATLVMAPCLGIIVFLLLVRGSMFIGWWSIIRNPQRFVRKSSLASDQSFGGNAKLAYDEQNFDESKGDDVAGDEELEMNDVLAMPAPEEA